MTLSHNAPPSAALLASAPAPITAAAQRLEPGALIELFELDATALGVSQVQRFHGGDGVIIWRGQRYEPWAIEATGFDRTGRGTLPAPTLRVGNIATDATGRSYSGVISALCLAAGDLVGARLMRRRTLAQYLDAANFPAGNPAADPAQEFPPEVWLIEAKTRESAAQLEFELKSALDFDGQSLPARQVQATACAWLSIGGYRGPYCAYTGAAMFDEKGQPVTDPMLDRCAGTVAACQQRFGQWQPIHFGGFPAADQFNG